MVRSARRGECDRTLRAARRLADNDPAASHGGNWSSARYHIPSSCGVAEAALSAVTAARRRIQKRQGCRVPARGHPVVADAKAGVEPAPRRMRSSAGTALATKRSDVRSLWTRCCTRLKQPWRSRDRSAPEAATSPALVARQRYASWGHGGPVAASLQVSVAPGASGRSDPTDGDLVRDARLWRDAGSGPVRPDTRFGVRATLDPRGCAAAFVRRSSEADAGGTWPGPVVALACTSSRVLALPSGVR